jgi:hypothetical protein
MDRDDADEALVRAVREGGGDEELAARLQELRDELTVPASAQTRWNHLAAMRRAAADPTVELPLDATQELPVDAKVVTGTRCGRRNRAAVALVAATVGVLGLTGGLAAAGRLPRAAQDRVADVANVVGIDLPKHDDARDVGPGNGREILRPSAPERGASSTAPPVGPRGPGATGTLPGSSGSAPGHSPAGPGSSELAPGHTKDTTGSPGATTPGATGEPPGNSGSAPGHDRGGRGSGSSPGRSGDAPGHNKGDGSTPGSSGSAPGKSGSAPGQVKKTTGATVAPGHSGSAPGQVEKAGSSSVQGTDQ